MDYMPGVNLDDCFENLSYEQRKRTAKDIARAMAALFDITSNCCGSILSDLTLGREFRSRQFKEVVPSISIPSKVVDTSVGPMKLGPINDLTLLDPDYPASVLECGPFTSGREFLEAIAFHGTSGIRDDGELNRGPYLKALEILDHLQKRAKPRTETSRNPTTEIFHMSHGDLSFSNMLVDPTTGAITAFLDWELAGFIPPWMAAAAPDWFDDDSCRFTMDEYQRGPKGYGDDTEEDTSLREYFRGQLTLYSQGLFNNYLNGVEFRAIVCALRHPLWGSTIMWIANFEKYEWDVEKRGPFPFYRLTWRRHLWTFEEGGLFSGISCIQTYKFSAELIRLDQEMVARGESLPQRNPFITKWCEQNKGSFLYQLHVHE